MTGVDLKAHGRRANFLQMFQCELCDFLGLLIRHETHGDLHSRPRRHNRLAAFALIAAGEAVDFECGPGAALLHGGEAAFAEECGHAEHFLVVAFVVGQPAHLLALVGGERLHVVVESGNRDAAILIAQLRQQLTQGHCGIFHRAAKDAGVQIARRAVQDDFQRADAAQSIGECRQSFCRHAGVGNHHRVATQLLAPRLQERGQTFAADFLLAFDDEGQVAGQGRAGFQIRFDGFQVREVLALVVA